jgi:hypothetical protein
MPTPTRVYIATPAKGAKRLVRADSQAQALRHASKGDYSVDIPTQDELVIALTAGIKVEDAKESDDE